MSSSSGLHIAVIEAREKLAAGREKLRRQHESGSAGIQVCNRLTDLLDGVVLDMYELALSQVGDLELESQIALVPNGGYGRRDVAPFSDVDLMLLHAPGTDVRVRPLAKRLLQHLGDAGLSPGFATRTPEDARRRSAKDATVFTTLAESRYLGGSIRLFTRYITALRRLAMWQPRRLILQIEAARRSERQRFGDTVYLLSPNIKRSRGGLRDLQMIRWIGFARFGECEPEGLLQQGVLTREDYTMIRDAQDFLQRLRNEMHFFAGKSQDLLSRGEQLRLAELYGYETDESLLSVERFMREYYEHTSNVRYASAHLLATAKDRNTATDYLGRMFSQCVGRDYRIGTRHIWATRKGLEKLKGCVEETLHLMELANAYNVRIEHGTWMTIRKSMLRQPSFQLSPLAIDRFLSFMSQPARLADLLRRLHQLRVLEQIIPPMSHARCLMQFNDYHKYTVDEHSIRVVQHATEFLEDPGSLGDAYRNLKDKTTLHLALLMHDLGKGYPEDHSDVGARLAAETAQRLGLPTHQAETLEYLVQHHLIMSHTALRKDLNDETVIVNFAAEVGTIEVLQMLYVLTCADIAGVGPDTLNNWKLGLITQLYHRTRDHLEQDEGGTDHSARLNELREQVAALVGQDHVTPWWRKQIQGLPKGYLTSEAPQRIVEELTSLQQLAPDDVATWSCYVDHRDAIRYTIGAHEEITPGIFHKLTGALTSRGMTILSAEIHTLPDQLALDRFYVEDRFFEGPPPESRRLEVQHALQQSLKEAPDWQPSFRNTWSGNNGNSNPSLNHLPTQVHFDNSTSERFTIITIVAYDRIGLLYGISRTLFQLALSIHVAKIATYLDQVVDVFYVTDVDEQKIQGEARLQQIRNQLLEAIEPAGVTAEK